MQDSMWGGRCFVFAGPETKKPSARAGFDLELQWRRSGYPASRASGRRAREVMPAAMRAEVRMSALAHGVCIGGNPRTRRPGPQAPSAVVGNDRRDRDAHPHAVAGVVRSEEHTSELQSLMRISY